MPPIVWIDHEVNAGMNRNFQGLALRRQAPHLYLGLGLINVLDLVEFKAILAHEYAHYGQGGLGTGLTGRPTRSFESCSSVMALTRG